MTEKLKIAGRPSRTTPKPDIEVPVKKVVRINFDIDKNVHRRLKAYCVTHDLVMSDVVRDLIRDFVARSHGE